MLICCVSFSVSAQVGYVDSLKKRLTANIHDTAKVLTLGDICSYYNRNDPDSAFFYSSQMIKLAQKLKYRYGEALGYLFTSTTMDRIGNWSKSYDMALNALRLAENLDYGKANIMKLANWQLGTVEMLYKRIRECVAHERAALYWGAVAGQPENMNYQCYAIMGLAFLFVSELDSAQYFISKGYQLSQNSKNELFKPFVQNTMGQFLIANNHLPEAKFHLIKGIAKAREVHHLFQEINILSALSRLYLKEGNVDSSIIISNITFKIAHDHHFAQFYNEAAKLLMNAYEIKKQPDSSLKYLKTMMNINDSVFNQARLQQFQLLSFEEEQRKQQEQLNEEKFRSRVIMLSLLTVLAISLVAGFILYRNNRQKQKANIELKEQKEALDKTLSELKNTQKLLIQSEKMASLGELTAGIAHEIQNPLNFVNNFSEVNAELLDDLREEILSGKNDSALQLLNDLKENSSKINHHGKRADSIVKNMLQHSRSDTGKKVAVDINNLVNEYVQLCYHGFRSKDKTFSSALNTSFDPSVTQANIIQQEIGLVLLNILNNALYAVNEKNKKGIPGYKPEVTITTKSIPDNIIITVKDNGSGISEDLMGKIFQPFFTTKPTGVGTGLGLSLSYDIIKAHGGNISVTSKEGESTEFTIQLIVG